jgi:hypothetical protein
MDNICFIICRNKSLSNTNLISAVDQTLRVEPRHLFVPVHILQVICVVFSIFVYYEEMFVLFLL